MRRLVPLALASIALLAPASAHAVVNINDGGYDAGGGSSKVTISPGSSVTWHYNNPTTPHGVQIGSDTVCAPNTSLLGSDCSSAAFPNAARISYHDVGCDPSTDATCITGQIVVYVNPTAAFTPPSPTRGAATTFDGSASTAPGGSIQSYSWDFGDGSAQATGQKPSHTYAAAGTYTAKLTIIDDQGNAAIATHDVAVSVPDSDGDGVNDDNDACPGIPGVGQPNGCPVNVVPPMLIPPEITTGTVSVNTVAVAGALKSGIGVLVSCSDTCSALLSLTPVGAPRLSDTAIVPAVATATALLPTGGTKLVTLKLNAAAKKSLKKVKSQALRLDVVVTDALGRVKSTAASVTLKALKPKGKLPAIGMSDQQPTTFVDPLFQVLQLKYARYVTSWNSIFAEPARLDEWLQAARAQGIRPLVSFEHTRGQQCPGRHCKSPSVGQYKRAWKAFHKKYPWVKDISPWNEANSATQPTGKHPEQAAAFYNVVRASCHGCKIVAADVLDLNNLRRYLAAFLLKAKGKPRLWGLHNYRDTNRFRQTGTKQLLAAVKGEVWFTETGGIVKFTTQSGKKALRKSEPRAKRAMEYMFKLAALDSKRVKRVYIYQWRVNFAGDRFDAGLIRPDGTPRPSYDVLSLNASIARKR